MKNYKNWPWRTIISVAFLCLFVLLVVKNWDSFIESLDALKGADTYWLWVAVFGMISTYFAAAGGYLVVSIKKLFYIKTLLAQVAAAFANKLLPSGIGGLGLNIAYLHKNKYTTAEATTVTGVNSFAAFVSFCSLLILAILLSPKDEGPPTIPTLPVWAIAFAIVVVVICVIFLVKNIRIHTRINTFVAEMVCTVRAYKKHPLKAVGAVGMATLVTLGYLVALYACARAMGVTVEYSQIFLVYVLGAVATAAVPTPGGLGAAEAALYAGFIAIGAPSTEALSIVLAYRFITYWLPIVPGLLSFQYLQKRKLL